MRLPKKPSMLLAAALLLLILYGLNYFVTPDMVGIANLEVSCRPRGNLDFDPDEWKQLLPLSGKRYEMVDNLLADRAIINLDANQIEKLLGKPDLVGDKEDRLFFYILGDQRAYPSKSIWFPGLFPNHDRWMLELRIRNGKAHSARVFFT